MKTVTVHEAKTHLSRLLKRIEAGEEIIIARGDTPVARLSAVDPATARRKTGADAYGAWAHLGRWSADADRILEEPTYTDEEWAAFLESPGPEGETS